jgi:hypothetical protein
VYFAPADAGDAIIIATRSATSAHPVTVRRVPVVGMKPDSTPFSYTGDIELFKGIVYR